MAKNILVHPDMKDVVQDKTKQVTVRKGRRDYSPGDRLQVGCDSYGWFPTKVTSVQHCMLIDVPDDVIADDGFEDFIAMYEGLQKFYPDIDVESVVTIIRWEYV